MRLIELCNGVMYVDIPDADLRILCACPADSVKHMMKKGLIVPLSDRDDISHETGPNVILLSDTMIQNGSFSNMAEFPVLQMLYRQGMIIPGHPGNTGVKPLLLGSAEQVSAQMQYIYRGNYGLVSKEEIMSTGINEKLAAEMMDIKLKFAFGKIRPSSELLDYCVVDQKKTHVRNDVYIKRLKTNLFEITYKKDKIQVDLDLKQHENYGLPYPLNYHKIKREYFGVIHSGNGDGWDITQPSMSSIIMYHGKIYLIDAGPNLQYSLRALGIGINEVEGIFHTHSHDDHFAGLTTLMMTDHKVKYFATPLVRFSVIKKLSTLVSIEENDFSNYFDVQDLKLDKWNDIEGLEVRPVFSPHPVENSIMSFRTPWGDSYKTYAHLADLTAKDILNGMVSQGNEPGVSERLLKKTLSEYMKPADLKKIDAGRGMIHGKAEDFAKDHSKRIILSHSSKEFTEEEKVIGSGAPFGTTDVLIKSMQHYGSKHAFYYLRRYFASVPDYEIQRLMNSKMITFNPESIIAQEGSQPDCVYLVISGVIERISVKSNFTSNLSAGSFIGESSGLKGKKLEATYRANSFVQALQLTTKMYRNFVKKNKLLEDIETLATKRHFLRDCSLFGKFISAQTYNNIAGQMLSQSYRKGSFINNDNRMLRLIKSGSIEMYLGDEVVETLNPGDFFSEDISVFNIPCMFRFKAACKSEVYDVPGDALGAIPSVRWKLYEAFEERSNSVISSEYKGALGFCWQESYNVGIQMFDRHHRKLFLMIQKLLDAIKSNEEKEIINETFSFFEKYVDFHFSSEEGMMRQYSFPGLKEHEGEHRELESKLSSYKEKLLDGTKKDHAALATLMKDWLIEHILKADQKYATFFHAKGVY